jgi:hypothetical protein
MVGYSCEQRWFNVFVDIEDVLYFEGERRSELWDGEGIPKKEDGDKSIVGHCEDS